MGEATEHRGSCHCGNVRFTVKADLTGPLISCNCSICLRSGAVLTFVPASAFHLEAGEGALTDYQFHKKKIHHFFCSTCGIRSFARGELSGQPMVAVNARCLEAIDLKALTIKEHDGRSQ